MSVLILDVGGANLAVDCERAGHAAPRKVGGGRLYGFAGVETSSTRFEAMVVPVVLAPLPSATVATIRAMFALGEQVPCSGDVFNKGDVTIICSGKISDQLHDTSDRWTVNLTLFEVGTTLPDFPVPALPDDIEEPSPCTPGIYWHFDAQTLTDRITGTQMAWWPDVSGNGRHATAQASAPNQPIYLSSSPIHGHPAVLFQLYGGNGRGYQLPGAFSTISTEAHLFTVYAPSVTSSPFHLGPISVGPSFPATPGTVQLLDHFGSSVQRTIPDVGVSTASGFVYHAHAKAGLWEAHVGLTLALTSASNTVEWHQATQIMGNWYAGGFFANPFQGYIGEFIVWCGPMADGDVTDMITSLGAKWEITV